MSSTLDFMSGLAAGWSQIITGQPFDFLKIKYQLSKASNCSVAKFARQIFQKHGFLGFYRGSSSLFLGFSFTIALQFSIYQACKKYLVANYQNIDQRIPEEVLSIKQIMVSGALVGWCVSFIYCPVQYAKIKKQTSAHLKEGSLNILLKQIYENRFRNIYKGLSATIMKQTLGSSFYYASYQNAVRCICRYKNKERRQATSLDFLTSGAIAGLSYWTVSYPIDVIKTKLQAGENRRQVMNNIAKNAYRGFSIIAFRSVLVNAISFATFQQIKKMNKLIQSSAF